MKHIIHIQNLKCDACSNTIESALKKLPELKNIEVDTVNKTVVFESESLIVRKEILDILHKLGYPVATEENHFLDKMRSYFSCAKGKLKSTSN